MKLKQRAVVTGSLFLGMSALFFVGLLLGYRPEGSENESKRGVGPPDIPRDLDSDDPDSEDRRAAANAGSRKKHDPLEKILDRSRRLQRKLELKSTDNTDKQPRGADLLNELVQRNSNRRENHSPQTSEEEVENSDVAPLEEGKQDPWQMWHSWVKQDEFYPVGAFWSKDMNSILHAMATYPITSFDVGHRGTQLKASMFLGNQRTAFKPMRYSRSEVIEGDPYAGYDRHNAEIAGFHLDGLLGFRIAPPVVGRRVNLTALWPITTQTLRNTYFKDNVGNTCFYGKCHYCRMEEAACAEGDVMEGSVTLWLPDWYEMKFRRHPYQRTYRPNRKAQWELDDSYCINNIIAKPGSDFYNGLLEYTDSCIFDFLMGNADRHHYETYAKAKKHGKLLHIDNGKSFGNPHHDEMSILAPISQCCRVRQSTWEKLEELLMSEQTLSQKLDQSLRRDPVYPILTDQHLEAINRRLLVIDKTIKQCFSRHGRDTVLVAQWPPDT